MTLQDSRSDHASRMHRVVDHIDREIDQALDLETLADVAHFSRYHFHRLFSAWMGETLGDYLRRRRLEVAAMRLAAQPRAPVLQIALAVGFGSAEAFSRAFRNRFGASPSAWRLQEMARRRNEKSNPGQANSNPSQAAGSPDSKNGVSSFPLETLMTVKLIDRPPATVACFRYVGPYGESLSRFWADTVSPWMEMHGLANPPMYGISHDDPSITAPEHCRYDACVEIPAGLEPTSPAFETTVAGGRYAALPFKGTVDQVKQAWDALLRDWLPSSGLQLDGRPCFEYYPSGSSYDADTHEFECDICIPVSPL